MQQLRGTELPAPQFRLAPLPDELHRVNGFHSLQTFFPTLSKLYRLSKHQSDQVWMDSKFRICGIDISGTSGPCCLHIVPNVDPSKEHQAVPEKVGGYLKVTHLLDPIRWMKGQYSLPRQSGLPWHSKTWTTAWSKLQDPWNQAYVEAMASYALGRLRDEGLTPHFNQFYGAFCARAARYRYNMTDEFGSLRNTRWFWNSKRKGLYDIRIVDSAHPEKEVDPEITNILLQEPSHFDESSGSSQSGSEEEDEEHIDVEMEDLMEKMELSSLHSDALEEVEYASGSSATSQVEDDEEDEEDEEDAHRIYAEFKDFPVMLIAAEENRGTMDDLLDDFEEVGATPGTSEWEEHWSAWIFQVLAALSIAQELLGFTHNDLHTNNVVWTETEEEYLYYKNRSGATFRVPTFGKLFRIIDFGRSIFKINRHIFISDDFRHGNDAEGQYNFKPLNPRPVPEEIVEPNPSFDLCRLAVSLFESLFPERPTEADLAQILSSEEDFVVKETVSPLYNVLWTWMIDDDGRNVLIEPDGEERFPDFDLYRHIAASVHGAIPCRQFSHPAFDRFQVTPSLASSAQKVWSLFC